MVAVCCDLEQVIAVIDARIGFLLLYCLGIKEIKKT